MGSTGSRRTSGRAVVALLSMTLLSVAPATGCDNGTDTTSSSDDTTSSTAGNTSTGTAGSTSSSSSSGMGGAGGSTTSSTTDVTTSTGASTSDGGSGGMGGAGGSGSSTTDTSSSSSTGSGLMCTSDQTDCGGTCRDNDDPAYGCGSCVPCGNLPNASVTCGGIGQCVIDSCVGNHEDCNVTDSDGCEIDLNTDPLNCGQCGYGCVAHNGQGSTCDGTGTCTPGIVDIQCSNWSRDASFDALKIDGLDIQLVGGMTGTSANDIYVSIATYNKGAIGHWNGASWVNEALPSSPNVPTKVGGIWTPDGNTVYATGADVNASRLFIRTGGVWTNAPNQPSTISMEDVTGTDANNVWILGQDAGIGKIWKKSGASWNLQSLPALPFPHRMLRIWALDANNVFATGFSLNGNSDPNGGILVRWNGASWSKVAGLPVDCIQVGAVHGTSINDLFVTGQKSNGHGVVYHVTNNLSTWDEYSDPNVNFYYPVWSKSMGAVLAGGVVPPGTAGAMRTTVDSMMSSPTTSSIDSLATDAVQFWPQPGSNVVHFVHISAPGVIAGHYTGVCN